MCIPATRNEAAVTRPVSDLLTADMQEILRLIWEIVVDPASKPLEALLIFGIVVVGMAMLLISVLLMITRRPEQTAETTDDTATDSEGSPTGVEDSHDDVRPPRRRLPAGVVVLLAVVGWWLATAVTTTSTPVCLTCHEGSDHALTQADRDPHEQVRCVRCHDDGGALASLTVAVPSRVEHVVTGMLREVPTGGYGTSDRACGSCHAADIERTTDNGAKAVKMSHIEPLAQGAECLDCHRVSDGVVGVSTTGMQPCLRCHNDTDASADCAFCHTGDIALAVAGRSQATTATAEVLVTRIDCGGCHTQETCDSCHGIRLPHTPEFMSYGHAREGVEDLWYNGGATCGKCHTEESRPCTSCHLGRFMSHGSTFRTLHQSGTSSGCDSCHSAMAYRNGRDFCGLCHGEAQ